MSAHKNAAIAVVVAGAYLASFAVLAPGTLAVMEMEDKTGTSGVRRMGKKTRQLIHISEGLHKDSPVLYNRPGTWEEMANSDS